MKKGIQNWNTLLVTLVVCLFIFSCKKKTDDLAENPGYVPTPYLIPVPAGFPTPMIPALNPMTIEGIDLGRNLYYDAILSSNGLSCSSCHIRELSFSTEMFTAATGEVKSVPPHINLAWNPDYNWNGSEPVLDHLCLGDFEPEFFNTDKDSLFVRLSRHPSYPDKFYKAFGIDNINSLGYSELKQYIVRSISQFMRSMVSSDSRYDRFLKHELILSESEMRGYTIFTTEKGDCFHCHGSVLATDNLFHNNGLEASPSGFDAGRFNVTQNPNDVGKFSSPTLRNVELTAPYMHDGRFQTLEDVVEFYNSGVHQTSPNIDPIMTKPGKEYGLDLTPQQKQDLVMFLKTFTDSTFINNPAYFKPF